MLNTVIPTTARIAREVADVGYCSAKKTYFHSVRLHVIAERRFGRLPNPTQIWLAQASAHDLTAAKEQHLELLDTTLIADLAYPEPEFEQSLNQQNTRLLVGHKKPKGKDLTKLEKYHNRLINKFRQPIESLYFGKNGIFLANLLYRFQIKFMSFFYLYLTMLCLFSYFNSSHAKQVVRTL